MQGLQGLGLKGLQSSGIRCLQGGVVGVLGTPKTQTLRVAQKTYFFFFKER